MEIVGQKLQKFYQVEQIMRLKIDGILLKGDRSRQLTITIASI